MRPVILAAILAIIVTNVAADDKKGETPTDKLFAKCVKILKYGAINQYDKASKDDAVIALGLLGEERAVPILVEHLKNEENDHLRCNIVKALGWIKSPKAIPALKQAMKKDSNDHVRMLAELALEAISSKEKKTDK